VVMENNESTMVGAPVVQLRHRVEIDRVKADRFNANMLDVTAGSFVALPSYTIWYETRLSRNGWNLFNSTTIPQYGYEIASIGAHKTGTGTHWRSQPSRLCAEPGGLTQPDRLRIRSLYCHAEAHL
jgi:hypothetical protein